MTALYLSRAQLKRDPAVEALGKILIPNEEGPRAYSAHRLVWSLFAGLPHAERDFLFRSEAADSRQGARARFFVLSRRMPNPDNPLLDIESKPFEPELRSSDRLSFSLRANATRVRKTPDGKTARVDVVMDALRGQDDRAKARPKAVADAGRGWLERQGEKSGFRLWRNDEGTSRLVVDGYEQWRFPGLGRNGRIATLDFQGVLEVTEPDLFLRKLAEGFGRAKAFGCGLMLIRRA